LYLCTSKAVNRKSSAWRRRPLSRRFRRGRSLALPRPFSGGCLVCGRFCWRCGRLLRAPLQSVFALLYCCTSKASKLNSKLSCKLSTTPSGEGTSLHSSGQRRQSPLLLQLCQYLYFCTSKASKLSTVGPVIPVLVAVGGHGALFVADRDARRERGVPPEGPREPAHLFISLFPRFSDTRVTSAYNAYVSTR